MTPFMKQYGLSNPSDIFKFELLCQGHKMKYDKQNFSIFKLSNFKFSKKNKGCLILEIAMTSQYHITD